MSVAGWLGWWVAWAALWLALTATLDPAELVAGAVAAALGATASELVRSRGIIRFAFDPRWLVRLPSLAGPLVSESLAVAVTGFGRAMGRSPDRGGWRTVALEPGGDSDRDRARRAVLTAAGSLAPNAYVVGFDSGEKEVLVHLFDTSRGVPELLRR